MEDVSEPGEGGVLVALVEKLDLFLDDFFGLRTRVLVVVHDKATGSILIFC